MTVHKEKAKRRVDTRSGQIDAREGGQGVLLVTRWAHLPVGDLLGSPAFCAHIPS